MTDIFIDANLGGQLPVNGGVFYHTNVSVLNTLHFGWHVDAERYWLYQDSFNVLNFIVYLDKSHPLEAGLQLVPFDALRARSPELHKLVLHGGALAFTKISSNSMVVKNENNDNFTIMDFHLDNVSCTLDLRVGDLLLIRGDVIHRTQPHIRIPSWRTSMNSLFVAPFENRMQKLSLPWLLRGGALKWRYFANDPRWAYMIRDSLYLQHGWVVSPDAIFFGFKFGNRYLRSLLRVRCLVARAFEGNLPVCSEVGF